MKLITHFTFDGKGEEALNFYKTVFNGRITELRRFEDEKEILAMPGIEEKDRKKIIHAYLQVGSVILNICDRLPVEDITNGNIIVMDINIEEEKETKRVFSALSEGGEILIPLAPASWTPNFGMIKDRFGICWNIIQED
ncbi:MAG: VOC family protein [Candidatus Azobacteroides sp.]|nr:VOC family protein [Candidatus Azobacteroides sp.]